MISQITNIESRGSFNGSNGLMYKFQVTFADGMSGEANSKSQTPPYRVGDYMQYEQTRIYQGNPCLKVSKPQQPGGQPPPQPYGAPQQYAPPPSAPPPAYQPPPQNPGNQAQWRPSGQSVGMSIVQACEFLRAQNKPWHQGEAHGIASSILRLGYMLEQGNLAPKPQAPQQPQPQQQYTPPPAPPAPPQTEHRAGQPAGPGGSVALSDLDEDVPFAPAQM